MPVLEVSVPIAHELIAQCIRQGEALVQRASLVGDHSDYASWKTARNQWIEPTVEALDHMYGESSQGAELSEVATAAAARQRWQEQYAGDVDAVKAAIELLGVLQTDLAFVRDEPALSPDSARLAADGWAQAKLLAPDPVPGGRVPDERARNGFVPPSAGEREAPPSAEQDLRPRDAREQPVEARRSPAAKVAHDASSDAVELAPTPPLTPELAQLANGSVSTERAEPTLAPGVPAPVPTPVATRNVLLAHGRNDRWMRAVVQLLEHAGSHDVAVLNERSGEHSKLSEQIGEQSHCSHYAIVLLTADDIGAPRLDSEDEPYFSPRAHQAVVFEMGFLIAALAPGHVCVLYEEGVQLPCDLDGIAYVRLDVAGTWQPKLLLALRKAGLEYDLNKLAAA